MNDPARWPTIADHRLLGDGRSMALVQPNGTVDWWSAPEPDSPPLLWSLLDLDGASASFVGAHVLDVPGVVAGPTLMTLLRVGTARVELWDGLVAGDDGPALVRLVRCLDADLDIVHHLDLGGFDQPTATWDGRIATLDSCTLVVTGGHDEGDGDTRLRARRATWAALTIAVGGPVEATADALWSRLEAARDEAEEPVATARLPAAHQDRGADAIRVLRACTYAATGAPVAAPTTSLPEAVGGDRNFDYRYTWLRDSSLALSVAHLLGAGGVAGPYVEFLRHLGPDGILATPVRTVRAEEVPDEREVDGVAGWEGSRPVRVGNDARRQTQYDALGFVLDGLHVHLRSGARLDRQLWAIVRRLADRCLDDIGEPTSGIWERRTPADLVAADMGRWVTLDRAVRIARRRRPWHPTRRWRRGRDASRRRILAALQPGGRLPQSYSSDEPDASSLLLVVLGLLPPRSPVATRLIDAVRRDLGAGPFVHRYPPSDGDGFHGREGAFIPVSWWLVSALALAGRVDEAGEVADGLCAQIPDLMPEQWDPARSEALGNTPLLWSHMEAARALHLLDAAHRGRFRAWRWGRRRP
ncbi:MAG TPA: glycoside hydrolase family 15 protein [Iamia sp.]|nr:glycoside hydrolase family 15 protein [Iamia sp.]